MVDSTVAYSMSNPSMCVGGGIARLCFMHNMHVRHVTLHFVRPRIPPEQTVACASTTTAHV